jgi:hypothetical protein
MPRLPSVPKAGQQIATVVLAGNDFSQMMRSKNEKKKEYPMKRLFGSMISSRNKKIACTVSAAALMLGVSSAATVGLHFQCNYYCSATRTAYSGTVVTLPAFGIQPNGWENLTATPSGYSGGACAFMVPGFTLEEIIDTTTSTNGLNPLPNGSLDVTWFANSANSDFFAGYAVSPPHYTIGGSLNLNNPITGEHEIYFTFLRDGINFGPENDSASGGADNPLKDYYTVEITGLKSLFTNTPFVIELVAGSDSMQLLTNAFITDVDDSITNSVTYPGTPPGYNQGGAPWWRGSGGGLSTASGVFTNVNHIHINSNIPQHGGTGAPPTSFDNAGTISGFIITDQPVVSMSPQSVPIVGAGDTVVLSAYAIGVPPLSYQWQHNGQNIPGANTLTNSIPSAGLADSGSYTLIVSNAYGVATSQVSVVTVDRLVQSPTASNNIVYDSNPDYPQHDGVNSGATWLVSSTGGSVTRDGVMSFDALETNGITVPDSSVFDGPSGTISFWMQSSGTDTNAAGNSGASVFSRTVATTSGGNEFILVQADKSSGAGAYTLEFFAPNDAVALYSTKTVSDNKWHFIALTFNQGSNGFADLYIDGALDQTNANGGNAWTWPSGPLQIASTTDPFWRPYNGNLDDFRYYSAALTLSEISSIYTSGALADPTDLQVQFNFTAAPGEGIVLSWLESSAVLQSAPTVIGPWTPITGASSPYTIVPVASQQFFRYVSTNAPTTHLSNPYLM